MLRCIRLGGVVSIPGLELLTVLCKTEQKLSATSSCSGQELVFTKHSVLNHDHNKDLNATHMFGSLITSSVASLLQTSLNIQTCPDRLTELFKSDFCQSIFLCAALAFQQIDFSFHLKNCQTMNNLQFAFYSLT